MSAQPQVLIAGAGIGGLTLALALREVGVDCVIAEAVPELTALGVGINLLPHATRELDRLDLLDELTSCAVTTKESVFYNRFGQLVHAEPAGRHAGYAWPQLSIHRGDLQQVLLAAVRARLGSDAVRLDHRVTSAIQDERGVTAHIEHTDGTRSILKGDVLVGADGVHSRLRAHLHPGAARPVYTGYMMWRGVSVWPPFLSGASMVRAGWFTPGKLVIYPIRENVDSHGNQLVNWVAELAGPQREQRDWNRRGEISDFIDPFADWHFDWLDVPAMIRAADQVLEYPMVDQDPLPFWGVQRLTLLGDAAHPMAPRGSNGAAQAILDARALATRLGDADGQYERALRDYERERLAATAKVVLTNRQNPPDAVLREVYERTGDRPFERVDDVISRAEISAITDAYRAITGGPRLGG